MSLQHLRPRDATLSDNYAVHMFHQQKRSSLKHPLNAWENVLKPPLQPLHFRHYSHWLQPLLYHQL